MQRIYDKCRRREPLSREEAYRLYDQAPLQELALVADEVRPRRGSRPGGGDLADRPQCQHHQRLHLGLPVLQFPLQAPPDRPGIRHHAGRIPREDRPYAGAGRRPAAVAGRPASATAHRFLRAAFLRPESALPHAAAACAGCARGGAHRPHQRPDDPGDPAPPDGSRARLASGRRRRDPRPRRTQGHIARQAVGRKVARRDARGALPRPSDLGNDDVRPCRDPRTSV